MSSPSPGSSPIPPSPTVTPSPPPPVAPSATPPAPTVSPSPPPPAPTVAPSSPPPAPTVAPSPPPVAPSPTSPPPVTPSPPPVAPSPTSPPPVTPSPPPVTPSTPPPATPSTPPPAAPSPTPPAPPVSPSTPPPAAPSPTPPAPPVTPSPSPPIPVLSPPPPAPESATPPPLVKPPVSPPPPSLSPPSTPLSPPLPSSPPPPPAPPSPSKSVTLPIVVGISAGGVVLLLAAILIFFSFHRKKRREPLQPSTPPTPRDRPDPSVDVPTLSPVTTQPLQPPHSGSFQTTKSSEMLSLSPVVSIGVSTGSYTYEEMAAATNGFSDANLVGQGGFGHVYSGTLNGTDVAVKKLRTGSGQGDREFRAEVEIISRVHHKNLVSLVGYCISGDQRLLAYEFIPNKTLEFHLHGSDRPTLDWSRRWKIALTSAKGLAYLHEDCHPKIIHRDIKAANILLDFNFEAKVADFGLAKIQHGDRTQVSTRVMGTIGYLAPEYASSGKVTNRSDVFSFGVVLLELITGRKPVQSSDTYMDETLVGWARPLLIQALKDENYDELIDPRLETNYDPYDMARLINCAAAAVRQSANHRPRMSQIIRYMEGEISSEDLSGGVKPGQSSFHGTPGTGKDSGQQSTLRRMAFGNPEDISSTEFSETTSEYGLNPTTSSSGADTGRWAKNSRGFSGEP